MIATTWVAAASVRRFNFIALTSLVARPAYHACRYIPAKHMLTMSRSGPIQRSYNCLNFGSTRDKLLIIQG